MKTNNIYILTIFVALALSAQSSDPPQYNLLYNISFPGAALEYFASGLYYFENVIYNATSGNIYTATIPDGCSTYAQFTASVIPWCYGTIYNHDNTITFNINFLNPYLNETISTSTIATFSQSTYASFEYTNSYIVFNFMTYVDSTYIPSVMIFDANTKTLACPQASIDPTNGANTVYTDGNIFLYAYLDDDHNSHFVWQNCTTGQNITTNGANEYEELDLYGFNNSVVFINYYGYQKNLQNTFFIEPGAFDSFNKIRFGESTNVTYFAPYNDTHFFLSYYPNGKFTFGLFVISPSLQIVEVQSFNLGIQGNNFYAYPIYGTPWISFVVGTTYITYDVNTGGVIKVTSTISPIILSNGSSVNVTQWGYFIQNPGGPFYFINAPYSNPDNAAYQDPVDINQYYTLFVPSSNFNYYSKCLLTHFNATNSIITQTQLPNCPLTLATGNPIQIKDVQYDNQGNPHVAYRDNYGSVFVVNI